MSSPLNTLQAASCTVLAGEKDLIEMCTDPENDVHRVCASLITGKEMWEITPEERSIKKRVNFGVVYLISGYGLAGQLKGPGYTKEDVEFCQEQLDAFYKRFKRIDLYLKKNAIKVKTNGYMKTYFNRIKYFKEIFDPDITNKKRASIIRQSNNMPVQGTAADVMKIAEVSDSLRSSMIDWPAPVFVLPDIEWQTYPLFSLNDSLSSSPLITLPTILRWRPRIDMSLTSRSFQSMPLSGDSGPPLV